MKGEMRQDVFSFLGGMGRLTGVIKCGAGCGTKPATQGVALLHLVIPVAPGR